MRYSWTCSPFLSLLFILSRLDSGICLDDQQTKVMKNLLSFSSSWTTANSDNPCGWSGVNCTANGSSVTELHMSGFGLKGNAWLTLCQLPALQVLDVSNNALSTPSDNGIKACTSLVSLNISSNFMPGSLPSFARMRKLQYLDVSRNRLGGNFGVQIQNLTDLRVLNLTCNQFTGSIPSLLGVQGMLEKLDLSHNSFGGDFPQELVKCTNLNFLDLSFNELKGNIPDSIGSLANLRILNVSANNFSRQIPGTMGNLSSLTHFSSSQNQLAGSIPYQLANLKGLQFLDLSYNGLNGDIPPEVFVLSNLQTLDLTRNSFTGHIPLKFSRKLSRLRVGYNLLKGNIPLTIGNGSGLTYLEMNDNLLEGQIPPQLAKCTSLQLLDLSQNKLSGSLTDPLASLKHLQVLKLPNNHFHGIIPAGLSNLSNLSFIDLSGNFLSGVIPPEVFELKKLQNLRLQDNNLTGTVPKNVQYAVSLLELQLGGNNLSGTIPQEIGSVTKLQIQLNLSCNSLHGEIPSSISGLITLEILDLSNNNLTGEVPSSLTAMGSLTLLNISNNRLTGVLPKFPNSPKRLIIIDTGNPGLYNTGQFGSATTTSAKRKVSVILLIGVAVAGAVFGVGAVALFIVARQYFRRKIEGHVINPDSVHRPRIDFEKGVQATLNPTNVFLKNKFSTYYKAIMPSGISFLVKKVIWTGKSFNSGNFRKLGTELEKQGGLRHPNIVTPLAHVLNTYCAYLFYEYVHIGCLSDFLHTSGDSVLDWPSRCSIAVGVAKGLAFLHGCQQPIFHLDLSTKNILLNPLTEPQIGDVELCKIIDPSKGTGSVSVIAGSVGYVPPEYAYTMKVTAAGNVYSFGVILLELLTRRPPITDGMDLADWVQSTLSREETWVQILDTRINDFSLQIQNEMISMLTVALDCISSSPESRPKMKDVVGTLEMVRKVAE
eukprot:PITA_02791